MAVPIPDRHQRFLHELVVRFSHYYAGWPASGKPGLG